MVGNGGMVKQSWNGTDDDDDDDDDFLMMMRLLLHAAFENPLPLS